MNSIIFQLAKNEMPERERERERELKNIGLIGLNEYFNYNLQFCFKIARTRVTAKLQEVKSLNSVFNL